MEAINFGIDLGTTNSLIAKFQNGKAIVFKNPVGLKETLPSVVAYRPNRILIGDKAREYLAKDPVNVFSGFKRKMGTDEKNYVVNLDENVTPVELSALILQELRRFVPHEPVPAAVITVPASFDSMQSNATLQAGRQAGFQEVLLLQEPIAACLAFFNDSGGSDDRQGHWLVYDLGGGTFDVALVRAGADQLKVVDHAGNNFLGGLDFDFLILEKLIVPAIEAQSGHTGFGAALLGGERAHEGLYHELMYYAEEAKKELSSAPSAYVEFSAAIGGEKQDFSIEITQTQLAALLLPTVHETIRLLKQVLENNNLNTAEVRGIILVGGSTYIPLVRTELHARTGIPINHSLDPTTCVAVGAAQYAAGKFYEPSRTSGDTGGISVDALLAGLDLTPVQLEIGISHPPSSRDTEEILIITAQGEYEGKTFRITRADGGFDTGQVPMREKKTEFVPLLSGVSNAFTLRIFDEAHHEVTALRKEFTILQGAYQIDGQPLPNDICIEVDDVENKTTKMELVFARNSLLPQKKTLYREISKTIRKNSGDAIRINILEGDRNATPASNLTIGCIEISGSELQTDLIKGSDIEIEIQLNDSRILSTNVFLVMTQQEYKNVFSVSEKQVNLHRLREQHELLEANISKTLQELRQESDSGWAEQAAGMLSELRGMHEALGRLKEKDKSDRKYVIAEKLSRISREHDKLGGNKRVAALVDQYLYLKEEVKQAIANADFIKPELQTEIEKIEQAEGSFIGSRSAAAVAKRVQQLRDLRWKALSNNTSTLIALFADYRAAKPEEYTDYRSAQKILDMAGRALEREQYHEFRQHIFNASRLLVKRVTGRDIDFKGTGIG